MSTADSEPKPETTSEPTTTSPTEDNKGKRNILITVSAVVLAAAIAVPIILYANKREDEDEGPKETIKKVFGMADTKEDLTKPVTAVVSEDRSVSASEFVAAQSI